MTESSPRRSWLRRLTATLLGLVVAALLAVGWFGDRIPIGLLSTSFFSPPSCLDFEVTAEGTIPDAMRHNWRTSRLDWVQVEATNRCPEDVSFDVTLNVERAFPVVDEDRTFGIKCEGEPCQSPRTITVPACALRSEESEPECASPRSVVAQLDPSLDWDWANWNQEDTLALEFNVNVVEHGTSARADALFGFLLGGRDEPGQCFPRDGCFPVTVELRSGNTYLWEWDLVNNPRPDGNPREAALASLAVWAIADSGERRAFAEQWPLDDSLDDWMERVYVELLSGSGFRVRTGADQLPPNDGDVVIDAPTTVREAMEGSPIETALLVATLASSAISFEDRNDHIIVLMAPTNTEQSGTGVFVAWVNADDPGNLIAFAPDDAEFKDFDLAKTEARVDLKDLPIRQILTQVTCERECDDVDGVYVDGDDQRVAAVNVMMAARYFRLISGLPTR